MEVRAQLQFVLAGGLRRVLVLGLDAAHLFRFQRGLGDHRLRRHAKIASGMRGFNVALITEEQLHLVPRELPAEWIADKQGIQSFRRGAASEAYAERAV